MWWPFRRREEPSDSDAVDGYTNRILDQMETSAAGESSTRDAVAAVEIAASMIGRAFASAEPKPAHPLLSPGYLELLGRALVLRGELVSVLEIVDGELRLFPASSWDITGGADPMSWKYRVDLPGPSRTRTTRRLAAEQVIHCRVNVLPSEPWRGRSPLEHAKLSVELLRRIEQNLTAEHRVQPSRIAPSPNAEDEDRRIYAARLKKGGILVQQAVGMEPGTTLEKATVWLPQRVGPMPDQGSVSLLADARTAVLTACGIPAELVAGGDGTAAREAYRRFLFCSVQPLARICAAEFSAKLDVSDLRLDFSEIQAADIAGRARAFRTMVEAGKTLEEASALAGLMLDD